MKIKCLVNGEQYGPPLQHNYNNGGNEHGFLLLELYLPQDENNKGPIAVLTWHCSDWHRLVVCELETMPEGLIHLRNHVDNLLFEGNDYVLKERVAWHLLCSEAELKLDEYRLLDADNFQEEGGEL
jgi:hypothetical protein